MKNKQKGFVTVTVIVVAILIVIACYVYMKKQQSVVQEPTKATSTNQQVEQSQTTTDTKIFASDNLTFEYPSSFTVEHERIHIAEKEVLHKITVSNDNLTLLISDVPTGHFDSCGDNFESCKIDYLPAEMIGGAEVKYHKIQDLYMMLAHKQNLGFYMVSYLKNDEGLKSAEFRNLLTLVFSTIQSK